MKDISRIKASFLQTFTHNLILICQSKLIDIKLEYIKLNMCINAISMGGSKSKRKPLISLRGVVKELWLASSAQTLGSCTSLMHSDARAELSLDMGGGGEV